MQMDVSVTLDNLTHELFKYIIRFDVKAGLRLCQTNRQYRDLLMNDTELWREYFESNWFPLRSIDNPHEKCLKFLRNPILINYDLLKLDWIQDWTNIVVGGGYVVNAVMNDVEAMQSGDIDIFFINDQLTKDDVVNKVQQLYSWMSMEYQVIDIHIKGQSVKFSGGCDSIIGFKSLTVQIIFMKLFSSVYDVITSFDLPNCSFAYQGDNKVYYTESALEYYKSHIIYYFNPTNCPRREIRMLKYKDRSYNTIQLINHCLFDCSPDNLIDYTNTSHSHIPDNMKHEFVSISRIGQYITL